MSGGIRQTELLGELHADASPVSTIQQLLDCALQHDQQARNLRRRAGRALAQLRAEKPETWLQDTGIDSGTAEMLLQMGTGCDG